MTKKVEQLQFDENIYDTIRRNIKKYRKEKGLTSAQLAEMVDLSHDFIRQIESEKVGYNFSVETFYKISVALGVSLDKLIEKTGDK
ncbi:XRE family transcriptional regulator [Enterocloster aldenensis]|uniref:helix-turn-helix transcriptional regulator n=1 Tax=Enterocloster aldenensis TaxID=358742 RepID=UPI000E4189FE|nr:XRE family transcriptional regulator [Enterocloster aldenensis]